MWAESDTDLRIFACTAVSCWSFPKQSPYAEPMLIICTALLRLRSR